MVKHWTEKMFVEEGELYKPTLEGLLDSAEAEADSLSKVFSEFQVPGRGLVLDLACGIGRHAVALARRGYRVVGVDISPPYISRAEEMAGEAGVSGSTEFFVGDMRRVGELLEGYRGGFDAVVNLFTSMGYWDEETDKSVFSQLHELSTPGGIFVLDTANRDWIVRNFQAKGWYRWPDGRVQVQERRLDLESSRMFNVWSWYREKGENLVHLGTIELDHRVLLPPRAQGDGRRCRMEIPEMLRGLRKAALHHGLEEDCPSG